MGRQPNPRRPGRLRVRWLLSFAAILSVALAAGYGLYRYQKARTTQRLLTEARDARRDGDTDRAIQSYRLYLSRNSADVEALRDYAELLFDRLAQSPEWLGDAIRAMRHLLRFEPSNAVVLERLVRLYLDLGEYGLALELGGAWANAAPESADASLAVARALHGLVRSDEAIQRLEAAIERFPLEPRLYAPLIELLSEKPDRRDEAAAWVERGLQRLPESPEVRMAAFAFHLRRGDAVVAESHLRKAVERASDNLNILLPAADYFIAAGRLTESEPLIARAIELAPGDARLRQTRIALALRRNQPSEMVALADELLKVATPADRQPILQAAELSIRAGAIAQADHCIERLEQSSPPDDDTRAAIETLRGARSLIAGESHVAVARLQNALRIRSDGLWAMELLARALAEIGADDEAAELYRRLIPRAPGATLPRLALARIELQRDRIAPARELLRSLSPNDPGEARQIALLLIAADLRQTALDRGKPSDCADCLDRLDRIAAEQPADFAAVNLLARCYAAADKPDRAWNVIQSRFIDLPAMRSVALELGRSLIAGGKPEWADQWADDLVRLKPDAPEPHALKVESMVAAGRRDQARQYIERCSLPDKDKSRLWSSLARTSATADSAEQSTQSLDALRRAASLAPRDIAARVELVRRTNDFDEAEKTIAEIRAIEGDAGIQWKFERASAMLRLRPDPKTGAEAASLLRDCLAARPGWTSARAMLGYAHETAGSLADAADAYRAAIARNPALAADPLAIRLLDVLKKLGRFTEADAALAPLIESKPDSPDVLRHLVEKQARQNDLIGAANTAERAMTLQPADPAWAALAADLHLRAGNPSRAEQIVRTSLEKHPDSIALVTSLARALFALDRADEAEQTARRRAEAMNSAPFDLLLARILVERGNTDEARRIIESALTREPDNADLHAAAAEFWGIQGDRSRQIELTRRAIELRGESPTTSLVLAGILAAGPGPADRDEALKIVRSRLAANPDDADAMILQAQLLLTAAPPDVRGAESLLSKAVQIDPRSAAAHKLLCAVQLQSGRLSAADATVAAGLARNPDDPELLLLSAEIHQQRGQFERSLGPLYRLLELQPGHTAAMNLYAVAVQQTGQTDKGIETISRWSPETTRPVEQSLVLARLSEFKGDAAAAEGHYRRAMDADRGSPAAFRAYLFFQARRGAFDQVYAMTAQYRTVHPDDVETWAIASELLAANASDEDLRRSGFEWLDEIADRRPNHAADARYRAGMARFQRGEFAAAEDLLRRAIRLAPDNARPVNALAWLYGEELGRPSDGLAAIESFLASGGQPTPEMLDTHGMLLLRLKRFEEARRQFDACLAAVGTSPTRAATLYHLGLLFMETGNHDDATSYIRQAIEMHDRVGGLGEKETIDARRILNNP